MAKRGRRSQSGITNLVTNSRLLITVLFRAADFFRQRSRGQQRVLFLRSRYLDGEIAERIIAGQMWQGQSSEQLVDALGRPKSIEQKVFKARKREVWKYDHRGGNRYGLRVIMEDGVVVGWEAKQE